MTRILMAMEQGLAPRQMEHNPGSIAQASDSDGMPWPKLKKLPGQASGSRRTSAERIEACCAQYVD
jgi:hypothetical protein